MGYSVSLVSKEVWLAQDDWSDSIIDLGNHTYNCRQMLYAAIGMGLSEFHGERAASTAKVLIEAVRWMHDHVDECLDASPPTGWGDFNSWTWFLMRIVGACFTYPDYIVRIE